MSNEYNDAVTDEECNAVYHRGIARVNRASRGQRFECPTCKRAGALSAWQKSQGYQCDGCADREEGCGF